MTKPSGELAAACPICGFEAVYIFISKHGHRIWQCREARCGHLFTHQLRETQGICARGEDVERESDESLMFFAERNVRLLGLFRNYLKGRIAPVKLLDFGAGNAHVSRTVKEHLGEQCTIYCLEPNPNCGGLYRKYGLIQVEGMEQIPDGIDLIYMIEVVEHLPDPIATLKLLRKSLAPEGFLFISTPRGLTDENLTNAFDTPSHLHFFTPSSLNSALTQAGFSAIQFSYVPAMYPLPFRGRFFPRTISVVKKLIRDISNLRRGPRHLVGVTRPITTL